MADDLDDFFQDVEEAEAEVKEEKDETTTNSANKKANDTGAEDNLDDFFQDVEEASAKVLKDENEVQEPPAKKSKTARVVAAAAAPVRPRGVVVAASSSVVLQQPQVTQDDETLLPLTVETKPTPQPTPPLPPLPSSTTSMPTAPNPPQQQQQQQNPVKRMAAGKVWVDSTLSEFPANDFRIFVGNLDVAISETQLFDHFKKYDSIAKAKVVTDSKGSSKGYGFVSFMSPLSCAKAIREMDQTWLGSRPIRVKRSDWKDRNANQVKKKAKQRKKRGY